MFLGSTGSAIVGGDIYGHERAFNPRIVALADGSIVVAYERWDVDNDTAAVVVGGVALEPSIDTDQPGSVSLEKLTALDTGGYAARWTVRTGGMETTYGQIW